MKPPNGLKRGVRKTQRTMNIITDLHLGDLMMESHLTWQAIVAYILLYAGGTVGVMYLFVKTIRAISTTVREWVKTIELIREFRRKD